MGLFGWGHSAETFSPERGDIPDSIETKKEPSSFFRILFDENKVEPVIGHDNLVLLKNVSLAAASPVLFTGYRASEPPTSISLIIADSELEAIRALGKRACEIQNIVKSEEVDTPFMTQLAKEKWQGGKVDDGLIADIDRIGADKNVKMTDDTDQMDEAANGKINNVN